MLYREFCSIMNYNEEDSYDDYGRFIRYINYCVNKNKNILCFNCENFIKAYKIRIEDVEFNFIQDSDGFDYIKKYDKISIFKRTDGKYEACYSHEKEYRRNDYHFSGFLEGEYFRVYNKYNRGRNYFIDDRYVKDFNKFLYQNNDLYSLGWCDNNISLEDVERFNLVYPDYKIFDPVNNISILTFEEKCIKIPLKCNFFKKFIYPYPSDVYFSCIHWQNIVRQRKNIDLHKCQVCGKMETKKNSLVIHHLTYERLGHEDIDDLITVCKQCHTAIHKEHQKEKKKKNLENVLEKMKNFKKNA